MDSPALLRFAVFELDLRSGELRRDGVLLHLQPQPLKVLALLASRAGEVVSREELERELWGEERFVDFERGLNSCILLVRGALGDDAQSPRFVRTVPRRGYQFLAPVERVPALPAAQEPTPAPPLVPLPAPELARARPARRALVVAAALVVLVASVAFIQARRRTGQRGAPARAMLAVLPFENLDAPGDDYFADGLTEELITRLGTLDPEGLGVIARTSVMRYKGKPADVSQIGRELGVDHLVEGSVRRAGGRMRITAQLIRVSDRTHVWAETYDREPGDAIAVQDDVAARVAAAIGGSAVAAPPDPAGEISPRFVAHRREREPSVPAHDAYLKARYLLAKGSREAIAGAVAQLQEAVRLDPGYARAHAALAEAYHLQRMRVPLPPREVYPKAEAAARKAVELDGSLAEAHTALAAVLLWYRWDAAGARTALERALALNPSYAAAHHDYAFLIAADDPDGAVRAIRRARELDPLSPRANVDVGWIYLRTRRFAEALAECRRTLELEPGFAGAEACVEQALVKLGREAEALVFTRRRLERAGATADELATLDAAEPAEALRRARRLRLGRLRALSRTEYVSGYNLAVEEAALGETDAALASLGLAFEQREAMLYRLGSDPSFDSLRDDPRFASLEKRVRESAGAGPR